MPPISKVDMPTIHEKAASILLKTIRARRTSSSEEAMSRVRPAGVTLREVRLEDFDAVSRLPKVLGALPNSLDNWYRLWRNNPALQSATSPLPMGWVLEAEGRI